MVLGRSSSRSRSKSRSPAPPPADLANSRRTFLPPSHYAAAGGFTHTGPTNVHLAAPKEYGSRSESLSSHRLRDSTRKLSEKLGFEEPNTGIRHQGFNADGEHHEHQQSAEKQHLETIPHLESQLLPSLRDTIDRMTRPSSRATSTAHQHSTRTNEDFSPATPSTPKLSNMKSSGNLYSTAIRNEPPSTPKARPKSVLRSALRSPGPKLFSKGDESNSASPSLAAATLVKSAIGRKFSACSTSDGPSEALDKIKSTTSERSSGYRAPRSRSRTDPGAPCKPEIPATVTQPSTPQPYSKKPAFKPRTPSQLPRPQARTKGDVPEKAMDVQRHQPGSSTDDSDLEFRYEQEAAARRRLVVANVDAFSASSSDSDSDMSFSKRSRLPVFSRIQNQLKPDRRSAVVGLGVNIAGGQENLKKWRQSGLGNHHPWTAIDDPEEDDRSIYNDDDDAIVISPMREEVDIEDGGVTETQRRRHTALLGIVDGLAFDEAGGTPVATGIGSDSEYHGEDGLAVSVSGDPSQLAKVGRDEEFNTRQPLPSFVVSQATGQEQASSRRHEERNQLDASSLRHRQSAVASLTQGNHSKTQGSLRSPVIRSRPASPAPAAVQKRLSLYYDDPSPTDEDDYPPSQLQTAGQASPAVLQRTGTRDPSHSSSRERVSSQMLTHAESDLSSTVQDPAWQDDGSEELSFGAEALFRTLSDADSKDLNRRGPAGDEYRDRQHSRRAVERHSRIDHHIPSPVSQSSSASSVYENDESEPSPSQNPNAASYSPPTWKSDLPEHVYHNLLSRNGECEAQRQQLIWDICESEAAFVLRLQTTTRLFVVPLRAKHSNTWIAGVPLEVAKLLDWLDDITALHVQMLGAVQAARTAQYPVVDRIADVVCQYVPRLEVYQPYLVRLADVSALIDQQLEDDRSDFAQFIKMQQGSRECGGWTLQQLLADPVSRLAKYPDFFRRLKELTCKTHSDYLSTITLSQSMNFMIQVMTEVKLREDEYDLTKRIERSLSLPPHFGLAKRDRRLLFEGALYRIEDGSVSSKDCDSSRQVDGFSTKGSARLVEAINEWDSQRHRAGSLKSTSSSSTGVSFGTCSSASSAHPFTPTSERFGTVYPLTSPHSQTRGSALASRARKTSSGNTRKISPQRPHKWRVFVFTDLVVFAVPGRSDATGNTSWTLATDCGISRILDVSERQDDNNQLQEASEIELEVIPSDMDLLGSAADSGRVQTLFFSIPQDHSTTTPHSTTTTDSSRSTWLSALRKCQQFTLRSMAIPAIYGSMRIPEVQDDPGVQQSVHSLLSSGLPIPKSPSVQLNAAGHGERGSAVSREREERGWWSLRFQQVLREFQRDESPFFVPNPSLDTREARSW
ncbi:hypothetical protein HGRIS_010976 [Hohenbuehelia grisea]|uniref:DH domain-containing protein n=1 Tax=Hohenbuehelia grisea TaxID=104357 RepID=A0ABR3IYE9_9AGAR